MFVPLERLYEFCDSKVQDDTVIYGFNPPGNKNVSSFNQIRPYAITDNPYTVTQSIPMIMHDQEPLNFTYYQNLEIKDLKENPNISNRLSAMNEPWMSDSILDIRSKKNLAFLSYGTTRCDVTLLTHSERNSRELENYEQNDFLGIYWWSHVPIAQDWYRFAKVDLNLNFSTDNFTYDFNVYNRAWSGSREYRLKFADFIIEKQLAPYCNIKFNPYDNGKYYRNHQYSNNQFRPYNDLEALPPNYSTSCASADYSSKDYQICAIDIVLETLFDDDRWHLTEKILRPIACGKPFILVGTMGVLSHLKSYGFRTFEGQIDESYDTVKDPVERLNYITETMKSITSLPQGRKKNLYQELHRIASYNKKLFWSEKFSSKIWKEFSDNYLSAYSIAKNSMTGKNYRNMRKDLVKIDPRWTPYLKGDLGWGNRDAVKQCLIQINKFNRLKQ